MSFNVLGNLSKRKHFIEGNDVSIKESCLFSQSRPQASTASWLLPPSLRSSFSKALGLSFGYASKLSISAPLDVALTLFQSFCPSWLTLF